MEKVKGFIYSRLERIGDRSQGPEYFLQTGKNVADDIPIRKNAEPWKTDPELQNHLAYIVIMEGDIVDAKLVYKSITRTDSF